MTSFILLLPLFILSVILESTRLSDPTAELDFTF